MNDMNFAHIPDENERASLVEQAFNSASVAEVRMRLAPESHPHFNGRDCVDCWDELPAERLADGRVRCVSCQTALETKRSRYR